MSKLLVAVYGSLRLGEFNNPVLKHSKHIETTVLRGFELYSLGEYPAAVESIFPKPLTVDLYEIGYELFIRLNNMEIRAGYELIMHQRHTEQYLMWVMWGGISSTRLIEGGDWATRTKGLTR
jgi:gamma-glutamylcyclotransferase (GGCT)/AIG2-like uncharacterized protein YtfP